MCARVKALCAAAWSEVKPDIFGTFDLLSARCKSPVRGIYRHNDVRVRELDGYGSSIKSFEHHAPTYRNQAGTCLRLIKLENRYNYMTLGVKQDKPDFSSGKYRPMAVCQEANRSCLYGLALLLTGCPLPKCCHLRRRVSHYDLSI